MLVQLVKAPRVLIYLIGCLRSKKMVITDLNHLELVSTTNVVGGSGEFNYSTFIGQYAELYQSSYATADAESQFGDAYAEAVSYNVGSIEQSV